MTQASKTIIPFTPPMECLPVSRIPEGETWIYELKLDGYRAQAVRDGAGVRLLSRRGKDLTKKYLEIDSNRHASRKANCEAGRKAISSLLPLLFINLATQ